VLQNGGCSLLGCHKRVLYIGVLTFHQCWWRLVKWSWNASDSLKIRMADTAILDLTLHYSRTSELCSTIHISDVLTFSPIFVKIGLMVKKWQRLHEILDSGWRHLGKCTSGSIACVRLQSFVKRFRLKLHVSRGNSTSKGCLTLNRQKKTTKIWSTFRRFEPKTLW